MNRCFPDGHPPHNQPLTYDLQCSGNADEIIEGRKSFPSGHSSCKSSKSQKIGFASFVQKEQLLRNNSLLRPCMAIKTNELEFTRPVFCALKIFIKHSEKNPEARASF